MKVLISFLAINIKKWTLPEKRSITALDITSDYTGYLTDMFIFIWRHNAQKYSNWTSTYKLFKIQFNHTINYFLKFTSKTVQELQNIGKELENWVTSVVHTCLVLLEAHINPFYSNAEVEVTPHFTLPDQISTYHGHIISQRYLLSCQLLPSTGCHTKFMEFVHEQLTFFNGNLHNPWNGGRGCLQH
jgi:hypothetical protein